MTDQTPLRVIQLTPPGRGAITTLLVEGTAAAETVAACLAGPRGAALAARQPDRLLVARFGPPPGEEVVVRRRADGSVEVHCHGGTAAAARIVELLARRGARPVPWRHWIRGRAGDRIAAAAEEALADAPTARTAAILLDQYHGALRLAIDAIRGALVRGDQAAAARDLAVLVHRAPLGQHLVRPWQVVVAGPPNAGKSSLTNAMLGYGRAIVHHAPGTTRDLVTAATVLDGWPVEVCDTAGLGEAETDLERAGIGLAHERMAAADLLLLVFDRSRPWTATDAALATAWPAALVLYNKADLPAAALPAERPHQLVSARHGAGVAELLAAIVRRLVPEPPPPGAAVPFTPEQVALIEAAAAALARGEPNVAGDAIGRL
jgi:tRNA modification GTPase